MADSISKSDIGEWETKDGVEFLKKVGLKTGQTVLDFGCRVGHYTIPAAEVIGNNGIVYAVDKEQEPLNELQQKAKSHNLGNVKTINTSGRIELDFETESIDAVLFYDVLQYHKKQERQKLYVEAYRVLKQDGLFSVYPKHTLEDNPLQEFADLRLSDVKREISGSDFIFEHKVCGLISHDDGLNKGCILNFRKRNNDARDENHEHQGR